MSQHDRILNKQYKISAKIGEGGMGVVYKAIDLTLNREVALKMIRPALLDDPDILQRFRREAKVLARLNHPNIATLYNLIDTDEGQCMVMEFVEGEALDKIVRRYGALPVEQAVQLIMQALEGLSHAHQRNVLHRDLKPSNLMLTRDGTVKIMDFGIARLTDSNSMHTSITNGLIGTFQYMAPELLDNAPATVVSDLYALTLVLYQLLAGKAPFHAATLSQLITKILHEPPSSLPGIPPDLNHLLGRMLAKAPEVRLSDSRQVLDELSRLTPYRSIVKWPVPEQTAWSDPEEEAATLILPTSESSPPLTTGWGVSTEVSSTPPPNQPTPDSLTPSGWDVPAQPPPVFVPPSEGPPAVQALSKDKRDKPASSVLPVSPTKSGKTGYPVKNQVSSSKKQKKTNSPYVLLAILLAGVLGGYWYWLQETLEPPTTNSQPANSLIDTSTSDSWSNQEPVHSNTLTPTDASGFEIATDKAATRSEPAPTISSPVPDVKTGQTPDRPTSKVSSKKTTPKATREKPTFATDAELNN